MNGASDTLFLAFSACPDNAGGWLFVHGTPHKAAPRECTAIQPYKPHYDECLKSGMSCHALWDDLDESPNFSGALILATKNITETQGDIARAALRVKDGGIVIAAADNDAGGKRLKKIMAEAGFDIVNEIIKNRARAVIARKGAGLQTGIVANWSDNLAAAQHPQTEFITQPGIYGWEKVDYGSAMLAALCDDRCAGAGADFGCGYGYLSCEILQASQAVTSMALIEADKRALDCARENLDFAADKIECIWADITRDKIIPDNAYDFILMNPPFHDGKATDIALGKAFIDRAAKSLKSGGTLWLVANAQLPYEEILRASFKHGEMLLQKDGFKIYRTEK